ncbi:MAG TPA: hypothetical protein VG692_15320 [Gemmatimonadales bacterium]|nr:hypothetical protein [Gemmatimonadales bacterium]
MELSIAIQPADADNLHAQVDRITDLAAQLPTAKTVAPADICGTVRSVINVLKPIVTLICSLGIIPGLKEVCKVLKKAIEALELVCPAAK